MALLGMNAQQQFALDNQLSVGGLTNNGKLINAALHNGFLTNFQGCSMQVVGADAVRMSMTTGSNPYNVVGVSQVMQMLTSDTTVAGAGFPDADVTGAGKNGVMRLTCNDTNTAAIVTGFYQKNALWIPTATNFVAGFDIAQWTERTDAIATQWSEFGVCSTVASEANFIDSTKEIAYGNGSTTDKAFAKIKLGANRGYLVTRASTGATAVTSAGFDIPAGAFSIRMEYAAATNSGTATIAVYVNNVFKVSTAVNLTGPTQLFARNCHSASYASGTQVPSILDIDAIVVALNN